MYEFRLMYSRGWASDPLPTTLLYHQGDQRDFASKFERIAAAAVAKGRAEIRGLAPHLLEWIAEQKNLKNAWDHLAAHGGQAPV